MQKEEIILEGVLEKVIYSAKDTHFTVARFRSDNSPLITIVGNIFSANEGERLKITGHWRKHAKFGRQLQVEHFEVVLPTQREAIEKYLASGIISGIRESLAKRIVKKFGDKTFDILDHEPYRIMEVEGIGKKKAEKIETIWKAQRSIRETMMFLAAHNITGSKAAKIHKKYEGNLVSILKNHPYQLAIDIDGIGFLTADKIAHKMGFPEDHPERLRAALIHVLSESRSQGHCFLPRDTLLEEAYKLIQIDANKISGALDEAIIEQKVIAPESALSPIYLKRIYFCEDRVSRHLKRILKGSPSRPIARLEKAISQTEQKMKIAFQGGQKEALLKALSHKISVITGGPGVGKTTIVKALVAILGRHHKRIALAAPTGRAAKRLSEASGIHASTIHRLLHYNPHDHTFEFNEDNKLEIDWLIIDETSMLDIVMAYHLLIAVPSPSAITFVGDADQLPSVGPGNFLADLIQSNRIPVARLTHIFRQATGSSIVHVAHKINQGEFPKINNHPNSDIFFMPAETPEEGANIIVDILAKRIPKKYGFNPISDIQVLTPMYRGDVGATNLNALLSNELNPEGTNIGNGKSRQGDKVMQTTNNYEKDIYNGDIGIITAVNRIDQNLTVSFDSREITYEFSEMDQFTQAYAISIHKSQGSEYPAVIIPLFTQHYIMLEKNLLYTAITRGKQLVILVGSWQALSLAVRNVKAQNRHTRLAELLE